MAHGTGSDVQVQHRCILVHDRRVGAYTPCVSGCLVSTEQPALQSNGWKVEGWGRPVILNLHAVGWEEQVLDDQDSEQYGMEGW